jgi:hypothetical protein
MPSSATISTRILGIPQRALVRRASCRFPARPAALRRAADTGRHGAFQWTLELAFDAADTAALRFEDVAAVPPEAWAGLRLTPHPALHVVDLRTNAVAVWNELKNSDHGIAPESLPEPIRWAIWRKQLSPYFRSLEADEAWALDAVRNHLSFGEICAGLCQWLPEEQAAPRAAALLRGWVDEGWIVSLEMV